MKILITTNEEELKILKSMSNPIDITKEAEIKNIVSKLLETVKENSRNCAGLAAPQIGYLSNIIAVRTGDNFEIMINPKIITKSSAKETKYEGCLSEPGVMKVVKRSKYCTVEYNTVIDGEISEELYVFKITDKNISRALLHEMDHLNGILLS